MIVEGRYKYDPGHNNEPTGWGTKYHRTECGWSDAELGNSPGESSLIGIDKRLSKILGIAVESVSQAKIPIHIGKPTKEQETALQNCSEEELKSLSAYAKSAMRIDVMLTSSDNSALPFPVYVEVDGSQHEQNRTYKGISQNHLDRCKDFCARVNQNALMIRVKSTPLASAQTEFILQETKRYNAMMPKTMDKNRRKSFLQSYIDCICLDFAENLKAKSLPIPISPSRYVRRRQVEIARNFCNRELGINRGYNATAVKLFNTWARRRQDLDGFIKMLQAAEGEKNQLSFPVQPGPYPYPYQFMDGIIRQARLLIQVSAP